MSVTQFIGILALLQGERGIWNQTLSICTCSEIVYIRVCSETGEARMIPAGANPGYCLRLGIYLFNCQTLRKSRF